MENPNLIEFYGEECPHCFKMQKIIDKFEKKHKTKLTKLEVWHNEDNKKLMEDIIESKQCSVPFFFNKENNKFICGEATLKQLEDWLK